MGQNRRTVSLLGSKLGLGPMAVLFGCGASPSLPAVSQTIDTWKANALAKPLVAAQHRQVIEENFRSFVALFIACGLFIAGVTVGSKISYKYSKTEPSLAA